MGIEEIRIVIDQQGQVQVQVSGIAGPECLVITQPLEKLLGDAIEQRVLTSDFHDTSVGAAQSESSDKVARKAR